MLMETLLSSSTALITIIGAILGVIVWVISLNFATRQNKVDITSIKQDIGSLRQEFKEDTNNIRTDITSLRNELTNVRIEVARQGERTETKIDMLLKQRSEGLS
jgi:hypothetical protein